MRIKKNKQLLSVIGITLVVGLAVTLITGHRWADKHVRYITGGQPSPLNCVPCHAYYKKNSVVKKITQEDYLSPLDIAVSPDGSHLYITAQDANALLVLSLDEGNVVTKIPVGQHPHSVVVSRDGKTAFVSNRWSDNISVIDLSKQRVVQNIEVGNGPTGMALGPDGDFLYVANNYSDDISVVELASGLETKRLAAGNNPYAVRLSPVGNPAIGNGRYLFVANRLTNAVHFRSPPVSEVTVVDVNSQRVSRRQFLPSAHLLESVDFTPQGDLALVTLIRPKNLVPATQVGRGWMMTFGLGIIETKIGRSRDFGNGGSVAQVLLDDANAFYADPYDLAITPDGRRAFITHAGANCVTVIDLQALRSVLAGATPVDLKNYANHLGLSSRYVIERIPTGANPKGLVLSPDGRRLYVAERLEDRVAVIDTDKLKVVETIELNGRPQEVSMIRRGQQLFNNASHAFQGQFSCRTCHPDGHQDALTYDFAPDGLARNLVNTLSLQDIGETSPFKWNGKNTSLYMQCGIRFAKFLTRTEPFSPDDLKALVAYIAAIPHPPNRYQTDSGELTPSQKRGKTIYERTRTNAGRIISEKDRCITCHPPPYFTNRQKADVGTLAETDSPKEFDTPHLNNVYSSAPFLHDGRAATLEEIWTKFNPDDRHGVANDLTKAQLNDLIEYLRVLGAASIDEPKF